MTVILTGKALADLSDIAVFIARDNPKRARTYVVELRERCMRIDQRPLAFPKIAGRPDSDIRRCAHGGI